MSLLLTLLLTGCLTPSPPPTYTVVRGDTLGEIATAHGVSVADLKAWNGLDSDRIDVGQVLTIRAGSSTPRPPAKPAKPRKKHRPAASPKAHAGPQGLRMPAPKPCLAGPTEGSGDRAMAASVGLDASAARSAVDAVLPHTASCIDAEVPAGTLMVELTVGCDGRVSRARPQGAAWPAAVRDCVVDVLRHASFPAHALPDGETYVQPVTFAP